MEKHQHNTCSEDEIWKTIPEYEGYYEVNNTGTVRSVNRYVNSCKGSKSQKKSRIRKSFISNNYYSCLLSKERKTKLIRVHRLVALSFIRNPESKPCINHIDGNKLNNNVNNLEWCTYKENTIHAFQLGKRKPSKGIFLVMLSLEGKLKRVFQSQWDAGRFLKITNIIVKSGKTVKSHNYLFKRLEDYLI